MAFCFKVVVSWYFTPCVCHGYFLRCFIVLFIVIEWRYISLNPGPVGFPCAVCHLHVRSNQRAFYAMNVDYGVIVLAVEWIRASISHISLCHGLLGFVHVV